MAFKWTNERIFKLLEMFKERELLWNTTLEDYKDRCKKHDAWCEIAKSFDVEKQDVERKVKTLIGQFQRELKKSHLGAECEDVSTWFAFKKMMFLKNTSRSTNIGDVKVQDKIEKESETEIVQNTFATPKKMIHRKRGLRKPEEGRSTEDTLSILKEIYGPRHTRDEFDVFGEHVAMKLRQLNSSYAKHTVQYHINNILYNAAMGEYDWPSFNSPRGHHRPSSNLSGVDYNTPGPSGVSESSANTLGPSGDSQSSVDDSTHSLEDIKVFSTPL